MQKTWSFFFLLFVIVLGSGLFRWAEGPTQLNKNIEIYHYTDRWTGQNWFVKYGGFEVTENDKSPLYSGESSPYLSSRLVNELRDNIKNGKMGKNRSKQIESRLENARKIKAMYQKEADEFIKLIGGEDEYFHYWQLNQDEAKAFLSKKDISARLEEAYEKWSDANYNETNLRNYSLYKWADNEARRILTKRANRMKLFATITWIGLSVATLFISFVMFIREKAKNTQNRAV